MVKFYFDRTIYWWGTFVENKIKEAEARAVNQTRKMKGNNQGFVASARQVAYCRLMGLPVASAYRQPVNTRDLQGKPVEKQANTVSAEGRKIDLSKFNG